MESSLSLAPREISSSFPVFSPLSTRSVGLLRSEFISSGRNLRLPQRRCRKIRPKSESNFCKFLFKASLQSQSIATVSAAAVVYYTYTRKLFDIKHANYLMETNVISGGALVVEAPEFQLNIVAPAVNGCLTSLTSEALEISSEPSVLSEYDVPPLVDEVHPSAHELSHSVAYELSVPVTQTTRVQNASSADHIKEVTYKLDGLNLTVIEESGKNNWDHIFRTSARNTVTGNSLEKLDNLDQLSSCATLQSFNHYSSPANMVEGSNLNAQNVILPLEKLGGERSLRYYNHVFLSKHKDSRNQKKDQGKWKKRVCIVIQPKICHRSMKTASMEISTAKGHGNIIRNEEHQCTPKYHNLLCSFSGK